MGSPENLGGAADLGSGMAHSRCSTRRLMVIIAGRFKWLTAVGMAWFVGQAILVALTKWDQNWDRVLVRWAFRPGAHYYRAG